MFVGLCLCVLVVRCVKITRGGLDEAVIDGPFAIPKTQTIDITDEHFSTLTERVEKESMFL